jgi:hypothetical protein
MIIFISALVLLYGTLSAQSERPRLTRLTKLALEGRPATLKLSPHVTTTIRLPEPASSIVVGDPNLFQAEHSPNEPLLVFARSATANPAESNLVITTTRGRQFVFVLSNAVGAGDSEAAADLLVTCRATGGFFIEDTFPDSLVSETVPLGDGARPPQLPTVTDATSFVDAIPLEELVVLQSKNPLTQMFGQRVRVAIGGVMEQGSRLIVLFSVVNPQSAAVELVPPQVQLAGQAKSGLLGRTRWTTAQQLPVQAYQLSARRLRQDERADGVVVFERPALKQSTEQLLLQIADSAAVDQPALAPISFRQTTTIGGER